MSEKIKTLREERAKIHEDQKAILEKAGEEKRGLTPDENTNWENLDVKFNELTDAIDVAVKERNAERDLELKKQRADERDKLLRKSVGSVTKPDPKDGLDPDGNRDKVDYADYAIDKRYQPILDNLRKRPEFMKVATEEYTNAYRQYLVHGERDIRSDVRDILLEGQSEIRALQADSDSAGGYLIAPEQVVMKIIEQLDNIIFMRQYATVIPLTNGVSLGAPARETDIGDVEWTSEILSGSMDTSLDFAKREMRPHPLARAIKVSNKLLRVSAIDIVSYITGRLAYKFGTVQENAFLNGTGVNQPLGVFTASDAGISTARDVNTGMTTTAMTADGLINVQMTLPEQYRKSGSCRWIFHRDALKQIRKIKNGEGDYIWKMGLTDSEPDKVLGSPYSESEYAPSTFTTGKYVGILGDFRQYWIVDSLAMEINVAKELFIASAQTAYFGRLESDGMPVEENSFVRIQLA